MIVYLSTLPIHVGGWRSSSEAVRRSVHNMQLQSALTNSWISLRYTYTLTSACLPGCCDAARGLPTRRRISSREFSQSWQAETCSFLQQWNVAWGVAAAVNISHI